MNKLFINILGVFLCTVFISSCNKTMEFEKIDTQKNVLAKDSSGCEIDIQFLFPSAYPDKDVLSMVQQQIVAKVYGEKYKTLSGKEATDNFVKSTLNEYTLEKSDMQSAAETAKNDSDLVPMTYSEEWNINTSILFNEKNLLSYEINIYSYTGGAHGMETTTYLVFNMKTGMPIAQNDIFKENYEKGLAALIKNKLMKEKQFHSEDQLMEGGYMFPENIKANNNFYVDETGITFLFNPYEIAAYYIGQTDVHLSFQELKPFLRDETLISKLY